MSVVVALRAGDRGSTAVVTALALTCQTALALIALRIASDLAATRSAACPASPPPAAAAAAATTAAATALAALPTTTPAAAAAAATAPTPRTSP